MDITVRCPLTERRSINSFFLFYHKKNHLPAVPCEQKKRRNKRANIWLHRSRKNCEKNLYIPSVIQPPIDQSGRISFQLASSITKWNNSILKEKTKKTYFPSCIRVFQSWAKKTSFGKRKKREKKWSYRPPFWNADAIRFDLKGVFFFVTSSAAIGHQ